MKNLHAESTKQAFIKVLKELPASEIDQFVNLVKEKRAEMTLFDCLQTNKEIESFLKRNGINVIIWC
jgi:7,8-dihydro-6-hydroxymethylpterin-pyrophosphokinase